MIYRVIPVLVVLVVLVVLGGCGGEVATPQLPSQQDVSALACGSQSWARMRIDRGTTEVAVLSGRNIARASRVAPYEYSVEFESPFIAVEAYGCVVQADGDNAATPRGGSTVKEFAVRVSWSPDATSMDLVLICEGTSTE